MQKVFYSLLLFMIVSSQSSFAKGSEVLMDSCNKGNKESCYNYLDSNITHTIVNGTILLNQACTMKHTSACVVLGYLFYDGKKVAKDYKQADHYFWEACILKDAGGCQGLADIYDNGNGFEKNATKALMYHELACNYGSPHDCYVVGKSYEAENVCSALSFYAKSCSSILSEGCEEYERLREHKECFQAIE